MKKLSMRDIQARVNTGFSTLRHSHGTQADMGRLTKLTRDELGSRTPADRRRYPIFFSGYAAGLIDAEYHRIMRDEVEFCYRLPGGRTLYSTWKGTAHKPTESFALEWPGHDFNECEAAHVWKGTDKAFNGWGRVA